MRVWLINLEETQEHILLCEKLEDKSLSNNKLAAHKWSPTNGKDEKKKIFDEMKNWVVPVNMMTQDEPRLWMVLSNTLSSSCIVIVFLDEINIYIYRRHGS